MNMERLARNARILIRVDRIITEIHIRQMLKRSGYAAFAAVIALFGLAMLNVAGFFLLLPGLGPIGAAFVMAIADFAAAVLLFIAAGRSKPDRELELAKEVHGAAADAVMAEVSEIGDVVKSIRHPIESALPGLLLPLVTMLLKALRKDKAGD